MAHAPNATTGELDVRSYLEQWLGHVRGRVRPSTLRGYRGLVHLYAIPAIGHVPLTELHPLQLQHLYGELLQSSKGRSGMGLSAGTVLNLHRVLVQSLGWAFRWGLIATNPAAAAQPPRPRRPEIGPVDPALAERILAASEGTRLELPAAFAIATGMRRGEILGLRWADIDPDFAVAHVRRSLEPVGGRSFQEPKTARSRRAVALPRFLHPYLGLALESGLTGWPLHLGGDEATRPCWRLPTTPPHRKADHRTESGPPSPAVSSDGC